MSVTSIKTTIFKHPEWIRLTASQSTSSVKIKIVNMDVAVVVSRSNIRTKEQRFSKNLGTFGAELEHFAHGRVTIDVGVRPFNIRIFRSVSMRNRTINHHKVRFGITNTRAFLAIANVSSGGFLETGFHQNFFNDILNLFNVRSTSRNGLFGTL